MTTSRPGRWPAGGRTDTGETALPSVSLRASAAVPRTGGMTSMAAAPTGDIPATAMIGGDGGGGEVTSVAVGAAAAGERGSSYCRAPAQLAFAADHSAKRLMSAAALTVVTPATVDGVAAGVVGSAAHHRRGRLRTHRSLVTSGLLLMVAAVTTIAAPRT